MKPNIKVWWRDRNMVWVGPPDDCSLSVTIKRSGLFWRESDESFARAIKDEIDRQESWNKHIEAIEDYLDVDMP